MVAMGVVLPGSYHIVSLWQWWRAFQYVDSQCIRVLCYMLCVCTYTLIIVVEYKDPPVHSLSFLR